MTNAYWYFGRATGVSALVLFTLVVCLGILVRSGSGLPGLPRFAVAGVHRLTSLTALGFLSLHVASLFVDPYAQLRLVDLVVPFRGAYRPLWQGLGTVAADLVVVLVASSLLRHRLGLRTWRAVHWAAYLCWPAALGHALGNGTDRATSWMFVVVITCVSAVAGSIAWRLVSDVESSRKMPVPTAPPPEFAGLR